MAYLMMRSWGSKVPNIEAILGHFMTPIKSYGEDETMSARIQALIDISEAS